MSRQIIKGRPDFQNKNFGITRAKRFPPFVFSTDANSCLVHKVASIEFHWTDVINQGRDLIRLDSPRIIIRTKCGQFFRPVKKKAVVCELPSPDALVCGRCERKSSTFRKGKDSYNARRKAHDKLGCLTRVET
jgi:hypothetical protein